MTRPALVLLLALVALAGPPPVARAELIDNGTFLVYLKDRAMGAEIFSVEVRHDSLLAFTDAYQTISSGPGATEESSKQSIYLATKDDFALMWYQSNHKIRGHTFVAGAIPKDTSLSIYREIDGQGEARTIAAPPGRLFIVDPQMFSLFNLIAMSLHGKTFDSRPLSLLTFGVRDSVLEARAVDHGTEPLNWGGKPVTCRRIGISDGRTEFMLWLDPRGRMLRLAHASTGLRVDRAPPKVKPRAPAPKPGG